jgi:MFS family permease
LLHGDDKKAGLGPDGTPWGYVFLFLGAGIVTAFQIGKAPPVLPAIRAELGMSLFAAGWILSAFSIIGLILGSIVGAISDAFGHRRMLLLGLAAQAAGSLIGAFSFTPLLLLSTRTLEGVGSLMTAVAAPSLIIHLTQPRDMRITLALWSCWVPIGAAIIMLLIPFVIPFFGWRGLWVMNAVILFGYALAAQRQTRSLPVTPHGDRLNVVRLWQDIRLTSSSPGPVLLAVIFSTYTLQWLAVMGFLPTLLIEDYGVTAATASILTGLTVGVNIVGNLTGGWLLHKGLRRAQLICLASLAMALSSLAIYHAGIPFVFRYGACLTFSAIGGILPASVFSGVPVHTPKAELMATTNGLIMQGSQLGQVVGPPVLALIVSRLGGWQAAPILLVSAAGLGIVLALGLAWFERTKSLEG